MQDVGGNAKKNEGEFKNLKRQVHKFDIYKKHKGIYWTNTLIIYCTLFVSGSLLYAKTILGFEKNLIDEFLFYSIILVLAYGVIMKFYGLVNYEALKGKLERQLILEMDRISIENEIYNLDNIQKIEIFNSDYDGILNILREAVLRQIFLKE